MRDGTHQEEPLWTFRLDGWKLTGVTLVTDRGWRALVAAAMVVACVAVRPAPVRLPKLPAIFHRTPSYGRLPLSFEPDRGSSYVAHGRGFVVALDQHGATYRSGTATYSMRVVGADRDSRPVAVSKLPGVVNYIHGSDRTKWRTGVPTYARVRYHGIVRGVDLDFHGTQTGVEYDFVVAPHADPRRVALAYDGVRRLFVVDGDLHLVTPTGEVVERAPRASQGRDQVRVRWVVHGHTARFEIGAFDHSRPLLIDPLVASNYATFLGGSQDDNGNGMAVDATGAAYITGSTKSSDFRTTRGSFDRTLNGSSSTTDAFVTKIDPKGTHLVYSTFIGGAANDVGNDIALTPSGRAVVIGNTSSADFPLTANPIDGTAASGDAFLAELDETGSALIGSTYFGGSDADTGQAVALNSFGNIIIVGGTTSNDLPLVSGGFDSTFNGSNDAFFAKVKSDFSGVFFASYLGGSGEDFVEDVAIDSTNNIVMGGTAPSTFPVAGGFDTTFNGGSRDGWVAKFTNAGALSYSTFIGGSQFDTVSAVAIDPSDRPLIAGATDDGATEFPLTPDAYQQDVRGPSDAFFARIASNGSALEYATRLGGDGDEDANGINVDDSGRVCIAGDTAAADFPTGGDAFDPTLNGGLDAYVVTFAPDLSFTGGTFLGGTGVDIARACAIGPGSAAAPVFVAGSTSDSFTDFKSTPKAVQPTAGGGRDAFVAKLSPRLINVFDVKHLEGDSGRTLFAFKVRLNAPSVNAVSVFATTVPGTATSPSDFTDAAATLTFRPGEVKKTFVVKVVGDARREPTETFSVQLSSPQGAAVIGRATATGTIVNDD